MRSVSICTLLHTFCSYYWSHWRLLLVEDRHSPLHVMVMHCFRLAAYRLLSLLHKSRCQSSCRCFILDIYYLCRSRFCLCAVPRPPDSINILTTLPTALRRTVLYKEPRFIRTAPPLFCLPRPHPPSCVRFLRRTVPATAASRRRQSHLCFCGRMSPGFAQISIRPRLLAAAARHGEIDQGEREGKHVEGKICNDKSMRQCLFPWNFNQFFSLVVFTYMYDI